MPSVVSDSIRQSLEGSSWIRKMFEEGARLKALHGEGNVFDFSLGNPILDPPPALYTALIDLLSHPAPGMHRYIPNAGLPEARAFVAAELAAATGLPYSAQQVVMTVGAAGAVNVVLKALLNPGDEVVTFAPYFVEYDFYAANVGGRLVRAESDERFQIDIPALERVLTPRTRAILLNSPNNPTGAVYSQARLKALAECLAAAGRRFGRPIFIVSDEPYRELAFDGVAVPWVPVLYDHTIVVTSYSKDIGIPAERLGYAAISPRAAEWQLMMEAMVLANRILGFVNAPALFQRALPRLKGRKVDVGYYQMLRDRMLKPLREMGYDVVTPQGAFYLFPKSPIADDVEFVRSAQAEGLLLVPGSGFGRAGHFRIALCVRPELIDRALPVFERAIRKFRR